MAVINSICFLANEMFFSNSGLSLGLLFAMNTIHPKKIIHYFYSKNQSEESWNVKTRRIRVNTHKRHRSVFHFDKNEIYFIGIILM